MNKNSFEEQITQKTNATMKGIPRTLIWLLIMVILFVDLMDKSAIKRTYVPFKHNNRSTVA